MFVSKNRTSLLIALAAMLSSANSFGAEENQGWGNWLYNQLPSRSSFGYYGGSALSGITPFALGYYTPIIERPSYALTKGAAMIGSPVAAQSMLDAYYQPTLAQQRRAQLVRALTGASAAGAFSHYGPYSDDWRTKLLLMGVGAALSGAIPSVYPSAREDIAEENALRRSQEIDQALERDMQNYRARSDADFLGGLREKHQYSGPFLSAEGQHKFNKLASIFGYKDLAAEVIEKAKARAAREKLESQFLESLLNVE